jgi:hypothetical protein
MGKGRGDSGNESGSESPKRGWVVPLQRSTWTQGRAPKAHGSWSTQSLDPEENLRTWAKFGGSTPHRPSSKGEVPCRVPCGLDPLGPLSTDANNPLAIIPGGCLFSPQEVHATKTIRLDHKGSRLIRESASWTPCSEAVTTQSQKTLICLDVPPHRRQNAQCGRSQPMISPHGSPRIPFLHTGVSS